MTSRFIAVDPFDLVVFGGAGDLAYRKLLPALFHRHCDKQIPASARIIGVSRRHMSDEDYRAATEKALREHVNGPDGDAVQSFLQCLHFISVDAQSEAGWDDLRTMLKQHDDRTRAFYLAVGPELFGTICSQLGNHGLVTPNSRIVIEKPIGHDLESAVVVNDAVGSVFDESQIYRIDHYLGKETVQNLMALRFGNLLFEPLWNAEHIDHVQITVAETIGVEGRGDYYDDAGALRDMVQNHMIQLLCLVAMEPPTHMTSDAVRDEKIKVLRALTPITEANANRVTVRGQYKSDASGSSYLDEVGNPDSLTESFVALKAEISNWRWAGVPFYLRTGKCLPIRASEIVVEFRKIRHSIFDVDAGELHSNRLVIRLQPDEGVKLWLMIKDPGPGGMRLRHVSLDMSFADAFGVRNPNAYERLLLDMIRGYQTLFMRRDEVEAAWHWVDPITEAWERSSDRPKTYKPGTWGPSAAIALIERDGRTWHDDSI